MNIINKINFNKKNNIAAARLFTAGALIFLFFLFVQAVEAQRVGIGVSPIRTEAIVNPGQVITRTITVKNDSGAPKTFYPYLKDFMAAGETGIANLIPPGSEPGPYLSSWVDIAPDGVDFQPQEQKEIPFIIRVPASAGPGGYYGAIVFGTEPPKVAFSEEEKGAAMSVAQQTASLILLRVSGDVLESAYIREFSTDKRFYSMPYEVNFLTRIDNIGNVHIKPLGKITVKNIFKKPVAEIVFNDRSSNILPKTIRRFENPWAGDRGFGKYTATLILNYGENVNDGGQGKQTLFSEISFWILPWKIIIPAFLSVVFFLILLSFLLKFYKNKAVKKAMREMGLAQFRYAGRSYGASFSLHLTLSLIILLLIIFLASLVIYFIFFA